MPPTLAELLELIGAALASEDGLDAATLDVSGLTDEELTTLAGELHALADARLDAGAVPTDAQLAELESIAAALEVVGGAQDERVAADTARSERAADLARRIRGDADPEPDPDGDPAEEGDDGEEDPDETHTKTDAAPVAASGRRAATRPGRVTPRITRVAARGMARPPAVTAQAPATFADRGLIASASTPSGVVAGQVVETPRQLAELFLEAWRSTGGARIDGELRRTVARVGGDAADQYGTDQNGVTRYLGRNPIENYERIRSVTGPNAVGVDPGTGQPALVAAGGICAPIEPSYELRTVGDADRPVRDALVRFGADRGGIRTMPGPTIGALDAAMSVWTEANDTTPSAPTTKPCLTITCPTEVETLIEALTFCLQTGNFNARYFPEMLEAWLSLRDVARARQAENRLLAAIEAGSVAVAPVALGATVVGAAKDVPTGLAKLAEGWRFRHRAFGQRMRVVAPRYLLTLMQTDAARELAYGTLEERLVVAESTINSFFAVRGIDITWHLDGPDVFAAQGAAVMVDYPDTDGALAGIQVDLLMFPEGAWLWLDGGQLDLGIIRDATLVGTNDFRMFTESFEGSHFVGAPYESWRARLNVCANGATGAAVAVTACS